MFLERIKISNVIHQTFIDVIHNKFYLNVPRDYKKISLVKITLKQIAIVPNN